MSVTTILNSSGAPLFNATYGLGASTDGAIRACRDFNRLGRHSHTAVLGYGREPIAEGSEFHTSDHTGPFVTIGVQA